MPLNIVEHYTSRPETFGHNDGEAERIYTVGTTLSGLEVYEALMTPDSGAPETHHDLQRGLISITPLGCGLWQARVKYSNLQQIVMNLEFGGEKIKAIKSKETVQKYQVRDTATLGTLAPSFNRLIGVGKDRVEGVEIYAPGTFKLQVNFSSEWGAIDIDYLRTVESMAATVNDRPIYFTYKNQHFEMQRGELLFVHGGVRDTNTKGCELSMKFEGIRNDGSIAVGDFDGTTFTNTADMEDGVPLITLGTPAQITNYIVGMTVTGNGIPPGTKILSTNGVDILALDQSCTQTATGVAITLARATLYKEGHHYMWLRTTKTKTTIPGGQIQIDVPDAAYVERVYDYANFENLQIFSSLNVQEELRISAVAAQQAEEETESENIFGDFQGFLGT